jgi:hypothetical protein
MAYNQANGYNVAVAVAAFELTPLTVNSLSIGNEPSITFSDVFQLSPNTANSLSLALEPVITYVVAGVFNLNPEIVNSSSLARIPVISFGATQIIGNVTVGYADDLYTVTFK